jgi:hypothetical protein
MVKKRKLPPGYVEDMYSVIDAYDYEYIRAKHGTLGSAIALLVKDGPYEQLIQQNNSLNLKLKNLQNASTDQK